MSISYHDLLPILADAIPGFIAIESDFAEPPPYVFMCEMVKFVCERASTSPSIEAERFAALIENLAQNGDDETKFLVLDAIEDMRERESRELIANCFGARPRELWEMVCEPSYIPDSPGGLPRQLSWWPGAPPSPRLCSCG
jgi:hypothetical protein